MKTYHSLIALSALTFGFISAASAATLDSMRWHRRILLVVSPNAQDLRAAQQRQILASWRRQADDRDLSLIDVSGKRVSGASDTAASLRGRYRLSANDFEVLLIGKDGHVVVRSQHPITAANLQGMIDAMPMRRAGER